MRLENSSAPVLIHVPLILRLPGPIPRGVKCDDLVSHIDLMPTVLELAGIEHDLPIQRRSLTPLIAGGERSEKVVFSEALVKEKAHRPEGRTFLYLKAIRTESRKLVCSLEFHPGAFGPAPLEASTPCQLFDLADDPGEVVDLMSERPSEARELKAQLSEWQSSCEELRRRFVDQGVAARPRAELDEESRQKARELGYLD